MNQLSAQDPEHVPDYRKLFSLEERVFAVLGGGAGIGRQSSHALAQAGATVRSEERRVGKECRSRWSPYH